MVSPESLSPSAARGPFDQFPRQFLVALKAEESPATGINEHRARVTSRRVDSLSKCARCRLAALKIHFQTLCLE